MKTCVSGATGSLSAAVAGALAARGDDSPVTGARLGERAGLLGGLRMAERLLGRRFAAGG